MIASEATTKELVGDQIREIFGNADEVSRLNACITSPRGDYFRLRLFQAMETPLTEADVDKLRGESEISEYRRHLHKLEKYGLVRREKADGELRFVRTPLAEQAINAVRKFERRVGKEAARAIHGASLGQNSIRLFLRIYGDTKEADWDQLRIMYTPAEIGLLALFLPRIIEGVSAIDKLNEADLLVYRDDDHVHMQPRKARSFYQYLRDLHVIDRARREGPA